MNGIFDELKQAFRRSDNALIQLILINVIVFLSLGIMYTTLVVLFPLAPVFEIIEKQFLLQAELKEFIYRPWTILTHAFNHALGDLWHILGNMLFLYWFGMVVVEFIGSKKLISLYVLGALSGGLSCLIAYNLFPAPVILVGASGAVFAVMVGAATIAPNYTFHLLFIGPIKIKYIAAVWILLSYIGLGGNFGGNLAHLTGALMGYIYIKQLQSGTDLGAWVISVLDFIKGLFKKKSKMKVSYSSNKGKKSKVTANTTYKSYNKNSSSGSSIPDQSEIDAILDKISESGYESLTKEEKQKLARVSRD